MKRIEPPLVIVKDTREPDEAAGDHPDSVFRPRVFRRGIPRDMPWSDRPRVEVPIVRRKLDVGDYSLPGLEGVASLERKSGRDLLATMFGGAGVDSVGDARHNIDRFRAELERARSLSLFAIVCEESPAWLFREARERFERYGKSFDPFAALAMLDSFAIDLGAPTIWAGSKGLAELRVGSLLARVWSQAAGGEKARDARRRGYSFSWLGVLERQEETTDGDQGERADRSVRDGSGGGGSGGAVQAAQDDHDGDDGGAERRRDGEGGAYPRGPDDVRRQVGRFGEGDRGGDGGRWEPGLLKETNDDRAQQGAEAPSDDDRERPEDGSGVREDALEHASQGEHDRSPGGRADRSDSADVAQAPASDPLGGVGSDGSGRPEATEAAAGLGRSSSGDGPAHPDGFGGEDLPIAPAVKLAPAGGMTASTTEFFAARDRKRRSA